MKHLIVIPYYCADEVRRYLWIADLLKQFTQAPGESIETEFLLAPAPSIDPSPTLFDVFSKISTVNIYKCKTEAVGYPQRATAMFWEIMEHIACAYPHDGGFVLWLESDMIPVRENWLNKLTAEWTSSSNLILMGSLMPEFRTREGYIVPEHINGGACYSKDFARYVPLEGRLAYFDLDLFSYAKATKRFKPSDLFILATYHEIPELILNSEAVVLHGYLQAKDKFIKKCVDMVKLQKEGCFSKMIRHCKPRRCCTLRYWNGSSFFCPIHRQKQAQEKYH
jgi:hypothetical protein